MWILGCHILPVHVGTREQFYIYLFLKYNNYIRNEVDSLLWTYQTQHQESFERSKSILAAFGLERTERLKW